MDMNEEIQEVRQILGEKFDNIIPDETVKLMIYSFKLMAKLVIRDFEKESE
ncbi:hypothetical protein [Chryseobacterium limigenitum]|uniref:Uncharacterized protein n=1 Tax=Chryseobacterium limigenitum TaxID=1612149 RepID=A0A1K2IYQ0_9FLAO|nr:hypothetical protein [Chryseobacterium limigenitum]SFZ96915.1 hypothetical protein SAMN05216324_1309 [Chryseobacterium limigenitum]